MTESPIYPLLMQPYFSARPWGGTSLRDILHKPLPAAGGPFGEAWELSDHPDGRSSVANGPYEGKLFGELIKQHPRELLGTDRAPDRYPLLVKYIDAAEDLSVQVHPTDAAAPPGDRGKTECWYIMHAAPGASMIWGLRPGVDAALLRGAADAGGSAVAQCIQRVPIAAGDFVYIPAGTVHATLGGTLLCEVQQSSNTTYRIYDWDRKPTRELHIDQSCSVTNFDPASQKPLVTKTNALSPGQWHELVSNDFFSVRLGWWPAKSKADLKLHNAHGLIVCVPGGEGTLNYHGADYPLECGQTWFLPARLDNIHVATGATPLRLMLSEAREIA